MLNDLNFPGSKSVESRVSPSRPIFLLAMDSDEIVAHTLIIASKLDGSGSSLTKD